MSNKKRFDRIVKRIESIGCRPLYNDSSRYGHDPLADCAKIYLGNLSRPDQDWFPEPYSCDEILALLPYTDSGDYSGNGAVGIANFRVMRDELGEHAVEVSAFPGWQQLGFRWSDYTRSEDVRNTVDEYCKNIQDYPLYNKDELCVVEEELRQEAWDRWAKSDLEREISKAYPDIEISVDFDRIHESEKFRESWYDCGHDETGGWYFDIEDMVKRSLEELVALGIVTMVGDE